MSIPYPCRNVALGLAIAWFLTPVAQAGELFRWFHKGCCDTTVTLPPQRVVVEAAAPRVAIQDTMRLSRGIGAPVFGAFYMPVAFPVMGLGVGVSGTTREADFTQDDSNVLRSAHAAELAQVRHAKARAVASAEVEAAKRVLERSALSAEASRSTAAAGDVDQRIKDLGDRIDKLSDRISAVERLTLIHDKYLREQMQKKPGSQ